MIRAVTSASNIHRRAACPGSERLEAGLPDEDSPQSREGSLLHGYASHPKLDRSFLKPNQRDLLLTSERLNDVIFDRVREQFSVSPLEEFEEGFEKELWALHGSKEQTPGHCDRYRYWPARKLLVISDDKYGYKIVSPAASNYQLRVYAIGGHEEWEVENCVVAIKQPRISFEERLTVAAYTREDILASIDELRAIRQASAKPDAPLVPGPEQCRYCKAKLTCPAYREYVNQGMSIIPAGSGTPAKREADAAELVRSATDEQLDRLLVAIQMAEFVSDIAKDEGRRRVAAGQLTTWKLGKEGETRSIADAQRAFSLLKLNGKLSVEDVFDCAKLSITSIQDKYRNKSGCTFKEAREFVDRALAMVIEKGSKRAPLSRVK